MEERKPTNFFEDTKPEVASLDFQSEEELNKFLEKVKSDNKQQEVSYKPLDIPKDVLPLDDSFSKVHDQDHVWGTTPAPKLTWNFTPSENSIQTSSKDWTSSTFAPTLETYETATPVSSALPPWNPPKDDAPSESVLLQHSNYSPTSQTTTKSVEFNIIPQNYSSTNDFWGNLKRAQQNSVINLSDDQKGPIYETFDQKGGYLHQTFLPTSTYPLQDNFQEPMKYHNFHPTEYQKLTTGYGSQIEGHPKPRNLFQPHYFQQQHFHPAQSSKAIFVPQNPHQIFHQPQMEYPKELFNSVNKQYPQELFQSAPEKTLFYPANNLPRENFFMSQDHFYPTSNGNPTLINHNTNSQPNPAILEIFEDAKRNKKHSRIRRSTKKIYHPNLLSAEDKRLAGVGESVSFLDSYFCISPSTVPS